MRIYRLSSTSSGKVFYHGSYHKLPNGTVLNPDKGNFMGTFTQDEMDSHFKLEEFRPSKFISRDRAVYMCDNVDDLDNSGAATKHIYEVRPIGKVERHDLNWMSEIDLIMDEAWTNGQQEDEETIEKVKQAALNYWNGVPHINESVWEYLASSARIMREV